MKIAVFSDTFYPKVDGIVTSILNFSKELIKDGHDIKVFCPTYKPFKELKMKGVTVHRFMSFSLFSYKEVKIVLPNIVKILRIIKEYKPDIIHIHTPGPLGYIGTLCARIFKIPCIGTYHTLVSEQLMYVSVHKLLKIDKAVDRLLNSRLMRIFKKRKKECEFCSFEADLKKDRLGKRIAWKLSCNIYNHCDIIIAPSESIARLIKEKGMTSKIAVVSNGINIGLFDPKKTYSKKIRRIVHVGRISFEKNADITIKAFSIVAKKNKNLRYVMIGDGPALESLNGLAKKLKLGKKIEFMGYIDHNKLPEHYKRCDIFVTASTMETQGLVILEAMATGLPVIGVSAYAIPDVVKNGYNGFVVPPGDVEDMAEYMELLVKNPKLVETLGRNSVKMAKSHDLKKTYRVLLKNYKYLLRLKK